MDNVTACRRKSSPDIVKKLWNCIKIIRKQRQIPSTERIVRHMIREYSMSGEEIMAELSYSVQDGLIRYTRTKGIRGSKTGVPQEAYRLPKVELPQGTHDWYCWKCHKSGEVIACSKCYRVFHPGCVEDFENIKDKFVCVICFNIFHDEIENLINRKDLNQLLLHSCKRLSKILIVIRTENNSYTDSESDSDNEAGQEVDLSNDDWQRNFLIYKYMDLKIMETRLLQNKYANLESFRADAELIFHNTVILYGVNSCETESVRYMVDECNRDIREILLCKDCFRQSNKKTTNDWFCIPCNPPHELVYAKQKGYCFWPAKVIKVENENYDVRFFGAGHSRAIIHVRNIRPICENIFREVKRTVLWNKAYSELLMHQEYLLKQNLDQDLIEKKEAPELPSPQCSSTAVKRKSEPCVAPTYVLLKKPDRKLSCSSSGKSDSSMPFLFCESSENVGAVSNTQVTSPHKNKSKPDETLPKWKRSKECRGVLSFQSSRSGISIKNDLSFDPNALQEELDKFLSEDVTENRGKTSSVKNHKDTDMLSSSDSLEDEHLEELAGISNGDSSEIHSVIRKLYEYIDNKKKQDFMNLKYKHSKEIARYKKIIEKLKRGLKEQEAKHQEEIQKMKKFSWCQVCLNKAIYYCCYNTSYCSIDCQKQHWKDHKGSCQH